jgi:hypothetical protein
MCGSLRFSIGVPNVLASKVLLDCFHATINERGTDVVGCVSDVSPSARNDVRGIPLNQTRSGKVVAVAALDELVWTKQVSDFAAAIDQDVKQRKLGNSVELRITGTATAFGQRGPARTWLQGRRARFSIDRGGIDVLSAKLGESSTSQGGYVIHAKL